MAVAVPRMYRVMRVDGDGLPLVEQSALGLGVRTPDATAASAHLDIVPDANDWVENGTGGMSVSPTVADLPLHRLPLAWRQVGYPGARGPSDAEVWRMGDGPFTRAAVAADLLLRPDPPRNGKVSHGNIEPARRMPLPRYREALALTRGLWGAVVPGAES